MIKSSLLLLMPMVLGSLVFGLEKDLRTAPLSELSTNTVQPGWLIIQKGVRLLAEESNGNAMQDGLNGHHEGYQSDSQATGSYDAASKLKHLNPLVHCGGDSMALHVQGNRVPNFMVVGDGESAVPVTQMPTNCGISIKRVRRDAVLTAQYQGCQVTRQGDDYVLPLRLWGAPVTMSCPVTSTVTSDQPAVPAANPQQPWNPTGALPYYGYPVWPGLATAPTPAPAPPPVPMSLPSNQQPWNPTGVLPYGYPIVWPGLATAPTPAPAPPPVPVSPLGDPQQPWNPTGTLPFYGYPLVVLPGLTAAPTPPPPPPPPPIPVSPFMNPQQSWNPTGALPFYGYPLVVLSGLTAPPSPNLDPPGEPWYPYYNEDDFYLDDDTVSFGDRRPWYSTRPYYRRKSYKNRYPWSRTKSYTSSSSDNGRTWVRRTSTPASTSSATGTGVASVSSTKS